MSNRDTEYERDQTGRYRFRGVGGTPFSAQNPSQALSEARASWRARGNLMSTTQGYVYDTGLTSNLSTATEAQDLQRIIDADRLRVKYPYAMNLEPTGYGRRFPLDSYTFTQDPRRSIPYQESSETSPLE